jgi:acyl carrier protein
MDAGVRQKRVEALEKIKEHALERAKQGADSFEVRDFVTSAKKELAYELPDEEAFRKAVKATQAYQGSKAK